MGNFRQVLGCLSWLVYPFAILFCLQLMAPRYVAILLAISLVLRRHQQVRQMMTGMSRADISIFIALLCFAVITALTDSEFLLRFYPLAMNLGMLLLFSLSLLSPPSMVERFARLREPDLSEEGVKYTRGVTKIWCVFFVINAGISMWTALYSSQELWALYNGFIVYMLMGLLFSGEWVFRYFYRVHS